MKKISIIDEINSKSGKRNAFTGDDDSVEKVDVIPTGILPLDYALSCGGIPRGRITDIFGLESAGKSSLCFTVIASAQKMGLKCALIDAEYSYTPEFVRKFGVETKDLLIIQPDCFEEAAEATEALEREKFGLIVIDSVSSLVPRPEAEAEHGKAPMAIQARLMSQMMRKQVAVVAKNNTALVCINQMRANLMATNPYDRYTVTGGFALKFYSSIRLQIRKTQTILKGKDPVGYMVNFQVKKNKVAKPWGKCDVPFFFDGGFSKDGDLASMAIDKGIFEQKGAWVFYKDEKWNGTVKCNEAIQANPNLRELVLSQIFPQK